MPCRSHMTLVETVVTAFPPRWRPAIQEYTPRSAEAQLEAVLDTSGVYGRILAAFGEFHTGIVSATESEDPNQSEARIRGEGQN